VNYLALYFINVDQATVIFVVLVRSTFDLTICVDVPRTPQQISYCWYLVVYRQFNNHPVGSTRWPNGRHYNIPLQQYHRGLVLLTKYWEMTPDRNTSYIVYINFFFPRITIALPAKTFKDYAIDVLIRALLAEFTRRTVNNNNQIV
jgi:hypothetical protein